MTPRATPHPQSKRTPMKLHSLVTVNPRPRDFTSTRTLFLNIAAGIGLFAAAAGSASALPLPQQAVYRGPAPGGPNNNNTFSTWLGRSDMWGLDFMADGDWFQIQGPTWILNPWRDWIAAKPGRRLILSVPMLPQDPSTTLATGATGAYNTHFATLAGNLISRGMGNTIVRPGWEFNGGWYRWAASGKQTHFINYWRHIVNSMRYLPDGVTPRPGANFQFCWNPNHGYNQFPAEQAYPGDAYVDFVGSDVYDQSWARNSAGEYYYPIPAGATATDIANRRQKVWTDDILNGNHGLVFWRNFCTTHGKSFVLPEWGCMRRTDGHGGQDNPAFITNMHTYMTTYPVAWASYFDADNGVAASKLSPTTTLPNASARFVQLFGGSWTELIKDNTDSGVTFVGTWTAQTSIAGFFGSNYLTDGNTDGKSVTYSATIPPGGTGSYSVYARWVNSASNNTWVPYTVTHAGGNSVVNKNQTWGGGAWQLLGTYTFNAGATATVKISNSGPGTVVADAVRFTKQ